MLLVMHAALRRGGRCIASLVGMAAATMPAVVAIIVLAEHATAVAAGAVLVHWPSEGRGRHGAPAAAAAAVVVLLRPTVGIRARQHRHRGRQGQRQPRSDEPAHGL
jgi:hypothetical protein